MTATGGGGSTCGNNLGGDGAVGYIQSNQPLTVLASPAVNVMQP